MSSAMPARPRSMSSSSPPNRRRRHAKPRLARVRVSDNGQGLEPDHKLGLGLIGMRERILALGGTLNVASGEGGVTVEALVPTAAA